MGSFAKDFGDLLSAHGGWGLAAVFAYVIRALWNQIEAMRTEHNDILKETTDMLSAVQITLMECHKKRPRDD